MELEVGEVYTKGNKTVLVFGAMNLPIYAGATIFRSEGIGVNLTTGKVDEVDEYSVKVRYLTDLDVTQKVNYGHFYSILDRMLKYGNLVAISGKARSGKDTLANKLEQSLLYKRTALGDPIRRIHSIMYGNSDKKDRDGLILIGQGMRSKDSKVWLKVWLRLAIDHFSYDDNARLVVSDIRQPNEFSFFKSMGAFTIRIDADEEKRKEILAATDGESALSENLLNDETESHVFDTTMVIFNKYDDSYTGEMFKVIERLTDEG